MGPSVGRKSTQTDRPTDWPIDRLGEGSQFVSPFRKRIYFRSDKKNIHPANWTKYTGKQLCLMPHHNCDVSVVKQPYTITWWPSSGLWSYIAPLRLTLRIFLLFATINCISLILIFNIINRHTEVSNFQNSCRTWATWKKIKFAHV